MFTLNDDLSIYATRGDIVFFGVTAEDNGKPYRFRAGDVVRIKVYEKKNAEAVVLHKDFPVIADADEVQIYLDRPDTKIGDVISKHKDYWYSVTLNDDTAPQTIIGYDEDGAKLFRLFPEGADIPPYEPIKPEDIPIVDGELDLTSHRPIENQAVTRAIVALEEDYKETKKTVVAKTNDTAEALAVERSRIDNLIAHEDTIVDEPLEYLDYITEATKAKVDATITSDGVYATVKVNFREANLFVGDSGMAVFIIPDECRPIDTGVIHTEDGLDYAIFFDNTRNRYTLYMGADADVTYAPEEACIVTFTYALADYELKDIRVGADGTIYPTAGEAVRAQLEAVKDAATVVTPQMFGAKGDGVHDDTEAVQKMVDYAAKGNKRVSVKEGKYLISKTIVCNFDESRAVEFIGCGQKSKFVVADTFDGDVAFSFAMKAGNYRNLDVGNFEVVLTKNVSGIYFDEIGMSAVIHDIFIDGGWEADDGETTYGIYTNSATVAEYRNNKIMCVTNGIVFDVTHSVHIDKCDVSFCKYGVVLSGGSNVSVTRCRADENMVGVLQNSSTNILTEHRPYEFDGTFLTLTISDNRFEHNSYAGVVLIAYANGYLANNNVNIERNYFTGLDANNAGIVAARCTKIRMADNSFKGASDATTIRSLGSLIKVELKNNVCVLNTDGTKCNTTLDNSTRGALGFDHDIETNQSNEKTAETYYLRKKIVTAVTDGVIDVNNYNVIQLNTATASTVTNLTDENLLYVCKELTILCDGKTTFKNSGLLKMKNNADVTPDALQVIKFLGVYADGVRWVQI